MISADKANIKEFWTAFCRANSVDENAAKDARTFSDPRLSQVTDEIAELARQGRKRGTAHLLIDFERNAIPRRVPGQYLIVLNAALDPLCVAQFTAVKEVPFNQVTAQFAASEGEGDLSLEYWASVHKRYFVKQLTEWQLEWHDNLVVVCESFDLRWPSV